MPNAMATISTFDYVGVVLHQLHLLPKPTSISTSTNSIITSASISCSNTQTQLQSGKQLEISRRSTAILVSSLPFSLVNCLFPPPLHARERRSRKKIPIDDYLTSRWFSLSLLLLFTFTLYFSPHNPKLLIRDQIFCYLSNLVTLKFNHLLTLLLLLHAPIYTLLIYLNSSEFACPIFIIFRFDSVCSN